METKQSMAEIVKGKTVEPNIIAVQMLGIGASVRITGVGTVFGMLRRGACSFAKAAATRLDT